MGTTFQAIEPTATPGESQSEEVRVIVTFSLAARQTDLLQSQLGPHYRVVDVSTAVEADVVICPPCSTRTIEKLRHQYPAAAILVVEPDGRSGLLDAPVSRILGAGVAAYITDPSPGGLASAVRALRTPFGAISRAAET
jgi:hypothetical protein